MKKKRKIVRSSVAASRRSKWAGMKFPEGTKRIVFNTWCELNGNYAATRRKIKRDGLLADGRAPSLRTLRKWVQDNHWDVLRLMVDDGIVDYLESQDDPDIRSAIRDEATFFKILEKLRSGIYMRIMEKNSELFPENATQAVTLLKHLAEQMGGLQARMHDARERRGEETLPDNVTSIASKLAEQGELPSQEEVARQAIRMNRGEQ